MFRRFFTRKRESEKPMVIPKEPLDLFKLLYERTTRLSSQLDTFNYGKKLLGTVLVFPAANYSDMVHDLGILIDLQRLHRSYQRDEVGVKTYSLSFDTILRSEDGVYLDRRLVITNLSTMLKHWCVLLLEDPHTYNTRRNMRLTYDLAVTFLTLVNELIKVGQGK